MHTARLLKEKFSILFFMQHESPQPVVLKHCYGLLLVWLALNELKQYRRSRPIEWLFLPCACIGKWSKSGLEIFWTNGCMLSNARHRNHNAVRLGINRAKHFLHRIFKEDTLAGHCTYIVVWIIHRDDDHQSSLNWQQIDNGLGTREGK